MNRSMVRQVGVEVGSLSRMDPHSRAEVVEAVGFTLDLVLDCLEAAEIPEARHRQRLAAFGYRSGELGLSLTDLLWIVDECHEQGWRQLAVHFPATSEGLVAVTEAAALLIRISSEVKDAYWAGHLVWLADEDRRGLSGVRRRST